LYKIGSFLIYVKQFSHIPGPTGNPILGVVLDLIKSDDPSKLYMDYHKKYASNIIAYRVLGRMYVSVASYDIAKGMLVEGQDNYRPGHLYARPYDSYRTYQEIFGVGAQNAVGKEWKWRRTALLPAFHNKNIMKHLFDYVVEKTERLCDEIDSKIGQTIDMDARTCQFTIEVIGRYLVGEELDFSSVGGSDKIENLFMDLSHEMRNQMGIPFFRSFINKFRENANKAERSKTKLHNLFIQYVDRELGKLKNGNDKKTTFSCVLAEMLKNGYKRDEAISELSDLLFAGHDTTSHTFAFCLSELSKHPEICDKALQEIESVFGDDKTITEEKLSKLNYINAILKETLRMYPPAWAVAIGNVKETTVEGYKIPANSNILLLIRHIHKDPTIYPDPDRFMPERYYTEEGLEEAQEDEGTNKKIVPLLTFSMGAHTCIGKYLAFLELRILLIELLQKFTWKVDPNHVVDTCISLTMRPKDGMPLIFKRRQKETTE
jgi:cytochrome P450